MGKIDRFNDDIAGQIDWLCAKSIHKPHEFTRQDRSELETLSFMYGMIARPILLRRIQQEWMKEHCVWRGYIDGELCKVIKHDNGSYEIWEYEGENNVVNKIRVEMRYIMTPIIKWSRICNTLINGGSNV